ncbi:hypothetical protein SH661x_002463 [Planctomicrobium sp. SH661]|uniref:tetratricopeptide repeat protein n=1 Tax=Planctomicrobium sp. SH661 TaxID=3448124 RepID=UPI003F5B4E26
MILREFLCSHQDCERDVGSLLNMMVLKMLKRNHPRAGGLAVRILGSLAVLIALGAIMYFALPRESGPRVSPNKPNDPVDNEARRCEDQLADLMEGLNPGRLGISSDRGQIMDRLNNWKSECSSQIRQTQPSSDKALIEKLLAGEQLNRTLSERYLAEDANHIRMCLLARDIVTHVVEGNTSNVDRAVSLFDFISRNVLLINDEIRDKLPLTPYESLLFGLGTAQDRAWIFAELLRQIRTDVVILTPRDEAKAEHWLVGVIEPTQGILLFDPRLGLPVPAAGSSMETLYPKVPATLQEVRDSDAALRQLDLPNDPYPLQSEDLKDLNVAIIGTSSGWAPRMALLQYLLPEGTSVDLYDGLGANELRSPGMEQRVVDAGKNDLWSADHVSIWPYPAQAEQAFEATRGEGEENSQLAILNVIFKGPYVPRPTGEDGKTITPTPIEKSLHFVRIEQLRGKYNNAIRDYLPVRTTCKTFPNPANDAAAEFGTFWVGVCQYNTQKIRTALGTLDRYAATQAESVGRRRSAGEYIADCLLAQKNYETAVMVMLNLPPGFAPRRDEYLVHRWCKIGNLNLEEVKEKRLKLITPENAPAEAKPEPESTPAPDEAKGEMKPEMKPEMKAEGAGETPAAPTDEPKPEGEAATDKPAEAAGETKPQPPPVELPVPIETPVEETK